MDPAFYLDVLPAHPRPRPLEALHSYVKRIARANGIHHVQTLSHFSQLSEPKRLLALHAPPSFGQLGKVTRCSEMELLALTTHFLACKFGREQTPGRFLARSVVKSLRWCPACLAQDGYYPLPWHFLRIPGCPEHGIRFLEVCPHCQQPIALRTSSLAFDTCPHCHGDLCCASAQPLTNDERQAARQQWAEQVYLLTPQDWEADSSRQVAAAARQRFGFLRRATGIEAHRLATILSVRKTVVLAIENETRSGLGETLQDYLDYADYLGLRLGDVFRASAEAGYIHKDTLFADEMLRRTQVAIQQLKADDVPVTQKSVGDLMDYEPSALRNYPRIHELLQTEALIRDKRTPLHEGRVCQHIRQVVDNLNENGERVTQRKVGLRVGYDPKQIQKFYPRAYRLLMDAVTTYQRGKPLREAALLRDVQSAVALFRQRGDLITQKAIAHHLGVTDTRLRNCSAVRLLIMEQTGQSRQQWLDDWIQRMSEFMEQRLREKTVISRSRLTEQLGMADHWFDRYPELMTLWRTFDEAQRQQRESDLVDRTRAAICACQTEGILLSFRNVSERVGLERATMKRYPRVLALLQAHNLVRTTAGE